MKRTGGLTGASPPTPLVRAAVWVGQTLGRWRRSHLESKNDAVIAAWKAAWAAGCTARWSGLPETDAPQKKNLSRDAWLAGWTWAGTHPDRRGPVKSSRRVYNVKRRAGDER